MYGQSAAAAFFFLRRAVDNGRLGTRGKANGNRPSSGCAYWRHVVFYFLLVVLLSPNILCLCCVKILAVRYKRKRSAACSSGPAPVCSALKADPSLARDVIPVPEVHRAGRDSSPPLLSIKDRSIEL